MHLTECGEVRPAASWEARLLEGPNLTTKNDHHVIMLSDAVVMALPCPAVSAVPSHPPAPEGAVSGDMLALGELGLESAGLRQQLPSRPDACSGTVGGLPAGPPTRPLCGTGLLQCGASF